LIAFDVSVEMSFVVLFLGKEKTRMPWLLLVVAGLLEIGWAVGSRSGYRFAGHARTLLRVQVF